jgi:PAS domain S-box-containing protein
MLDVNPAFCRMLGYTRGELLQLAIPDVEGNESPQEVVAHMAKIVNDGHDRFDTRHRRKDGTIIEVEISVNLVELDGAKMFYAFVRDISERKQGEQALILSKNEAERANAAKSEFLSRMSHELRTPLNAVLGFGELLETDTAHPLTEEQNDHVREILHAGNHLLAMVDEVLDLSRIESGRLELSLEPVALAPMIEACVAQLRPLAAQRGIQVTLEPDLLHTVQADRTRLKEVLLNLLSNAVKYNREGGAIDVRCTPLENKRLRISVHDTGHGIDADALPRLFQPFERLDSAYTGIQGTGIGLALSKILVEGMRGAIGVESVPGAGSTFWFELPLAEERESIPEAAAAILAKTPISASRHKILYIEDNPANMRLVQKIVTSREGIEFLEAVDGEAGLLIAIEQQPDLILLDINLPGMDGFEVLRLLRENSVTRAIPVVAISANAMSRDIERGMAAGFSDYLTKPLEVQRLLSVVDRILLAGEYLN